MIKVILADTKEVLAEFKHNTIDEVIEYSREVLPYNVVAPEVQTWRVISYQLNEIYRIGFGNEFKEFKEEIDELKKYVDFKIKRCDKKIAQFYGRFIKQELISKGYKLS